jgi:site-specific DNA-methyltransferase (adenine-specific)
VKKKLDDDPTVSRFENIKAFTHFTKSWLQLAVQYIKPNAPIIIWTNALGKAPTINLCQQMNYTMVGEFLWAKRTKVMSQEEMLTSTKNEVLLRIYETALVFLPDNSNDYSNHNSNSNNNINNSNRVDSKNNNVLPHRSQPLAPNNAAIPWSCVTGYHDINSDTDTSNNTNSNHNNIVAHAHPCHKPYEAIEPLIRTWTKPGLCMSYYMFIHRHD